MRRRRFISSIAAGAALSGLKAQAAKKAPLNIMLITADDLNKDSLGCFGSKVLGISPNIDKFASEGMRFARGHVNVAICQPSRGVLATGRYSQNSGIMGFMHTERPIPTITESFGAAGYLTGVLGKVGHSSPKPDTHWDFSHDQSELGDGRSPTRYHDYCVEFLTRCRNENKPFYFMVNSHDPHRPYHIPGVPLKSKKSGGGAEEPSRIYRPDEIVVPGFVPDLPGVREELSWYFNSVKRLDDTFGAVMRALDETGFRDSTIVMFLSDNGIAIPFAKCNVYLTSTNTPWLVRWPGIVKPGSVDQTDFISGIDFFPTVLDAAGLPPAEGVDGVSFVPLLKGGTQAGRDKVFTQIDSKAGGAAVPMRCVQDKKFGYMYNMWSDGEYEYHNNNEGQTWKAMVEAAENDPAIAERVRMFRIRVPEEFYDLEKDPSCLHNLIDDPEYKPALDRMRATLVEHMKDSKDPALKAFENRHDRETVKAVFADVYPGQVEKKSKNAGGKKSKKNKKKK